MSRRHYVRVGHLPQALRINAKWWDIKHYARVPIILTVVIAFTLTQTAVFLFSDTADAAALTVASSTSETEETNATGVYANTDTSIASGSLPAGTYFVAWGAAAGYVNNGTPSEVRLLRGATTIAELAHESGAATNASMGPARSGYWLGSLSGSEALTIQFRGGGNTAYIDSKFIKAIRLDTELTADVDYFTSGSQESSTPEVTDAATGSWTDVKTLTKTFSSYDTEDYLLFASMEAFPNDATGVNHCMSQVEVDGTPIMESRMQAEDVNDRHGYALAKLVSIGSGSKSIKLQAQSVTAATCDYSRSRIYVFRASVFDQVVEDYVAGESTATSASWPTKNTISYTPNQSETVMVIGSSARGSGLGNCTITTRYNDGTTQYGDATGYISNDSANDYYIGMYAASTTISSATTFTKQYQRNSGTCTVKIKESTFIVWSMTLRDDATYSQSAYRWFANATTPLANMNTAHTLAAPGDTFRLRMLLHVANNDLPTGSINFKLQFATKSGSCDTAYSGETYADVGTSSGAIRYYDNGGVADGSAFVADGDDPTHSSDTIVAQTYEEANNFTSTSRINRGQDGKWEFALVDFAGGSNTSYCFRVVQSDGTALATPTVVPEITTATSNTAPDNAASLAQKKTDNTVLATGDWTNEVDGSSQPTIKFTATVSDPDASDTLQLCVEIDQLGTGFSNTEDACGSGVSYSGSGVAASVTLAGITDAAEYHWQARVKDAGGLYSSWVSYDSNLESVRDFGVDTTAPTGGTVYDGTTTSVDKSFSDSSLSALSANWSDFNFNASGILRYDYSIGTTVGGTDIKGWTNNSTTTSVTSTGLTLQTSKVYYVNVRAYDNAGNVSTVSSDGQLVAPSLTFSVSPASLTFDNLNAANSYTATEDTTLTTSTNAYGGYVVRLAATDYLRFGSYTIPDFNGGSYASPDSWQTGDIGFGYTSSDTDIQGVNKFQPTTCPGGSAKVAPGCFAPYSQTKPGDIVADHTANVTGSPISGEQFTITHQATVSPTQPAAPYSAVLIYTITALY